MDTNSNQNCGFAKIMAFAYKCGQKISTSVGLTKIRAFAGKCGQNCANLVRRNNISLHSTTRIINLIAIFHEDGTGHLHEKKKPLGNLVVS